METLTILGCDIEFDKFYKLPQYGDGSELSDAAISQIKRTAIRYLSPPDNLPQKEFDDLKFKLHHDFQSLLPKNFSWVSRRPTNESLSRSLPNYFSQLGWRVNSYFGEEIGNIINKYPSLCQDLYIRVSNEMDWQSGDFGDGGSCFWQDRWKAREFITDMDEFFVVKFYRVEDRDEITTSTRPRDRGVARIIAYYEPTDSREVLFWNGYGWNTPTLTSYLVSFFNQLRQEQHGEKEPLFVDRDYLYFDGTDHGVMYVNNGTCYSVRGVSDEAIVERDLETGLPNLCRMCEDGWVVNGEEYCPVCLEEGTYCDDCDRFVFEYCYVESCDRTVCEDCLSSNYPPCDQCCEPVSEVYDFDNGYCILHLCEVCLEEATTTCANCESAVNTDFSFRYHSHEPVCSECYAKLKES